MSAIHILVVDDYVVAAEFLGHLVKQVMNNIKITIRHDGFEALDVVTQTSVDIIITDYSMPGMDGLELVQSIRELSPDTQIVITSAYSEKSLQKLTSEADLKYFIKKPVRQQQVNSLMQKVIKNVENIRQRRNTVPTKLANNIDVSSGIIYQLDDLRRETNAHYCFMINEAGYVLAQSGNDKKIPVPILASLAAANVMATTEISSLLGNPDPFHSIIQEGTIYNVAFYNIGGGTYLVVIFGKKTKTGVIQHYARQTIANLPSLPKIDQRPSTNGKLTEENFTTDIDSSLDELFMMN